MHSINNTFNWRVEASQNWKDLKTGLAFTFFNILCGLQFLSTENVSQDTFSNTNKSEKNLNLFMKINTDIFATRGGEKDRFHTELCSKQVTHYSRSITIKN